MEQKREEEHVVTAGSRVGRSVSRTEIVLEESETLKREGNRLYKEGEYETCLEKYAEALDLILGNEVDSKENDSRSLSMVAVLHVNIAAAYGQRGEWRKVLDHASQSMAADGQDRAGVKWKALYRRGLALKHLKSYHQSIIEFTSLLQIKPNYEAAKKQLSRVKAIVSKKTSTFGVAPPAPPLTTIVGLKSRNVGINEFKMEGSLGEGNFSNVFKVSDKVTKEVFALKTIEMKKVQRLRIRHQNIDNEIMMEKSVLAKLNHPGIIRLYHTFKDATNLYFLLEYCPGGELWQALNRFDEMIGVRPSLARFYAAQIVSALAYLRSQGIVHRDLKPENMMLTESGHVKIVDFGTAKDLRDTKFNGNEFVGTPEYMAPAALKNFSATCDADLWSLGSVIYQLHTGYPPFKALSPFLAMQKAMHRQIFFPDFFPDDARDLVSKLLVWNASDRLGARAGNGGDKDEPLGDIRNHRYFAGVRWEGVHSDPPPEATLGELCMETHILPEPWKHRGYEKLKPATRGYVMHVLERRNKLLPVMRRFFSNPNAANCCRARNRGYLGLQRRGEDEFEDTLRFVTMSRPSMNTSSTDRKNLLRVFVKRVNEMVPSPRALLIMGPLTASSPGSAAYQHDVDALHEVLSELKSEILPMFAPSKHDTTSEAGGVDGVEFYRKNFGDDFYSTWFGGVKLVVLNGALLPSSVDEMERCDDDEQQRWLKYEMYNGNLCAHHMIVAMSRDVAIPIESDADPMCSILEGMKKKKVRALLLPSSPATKESGGGTALRVTSISHICELRGLEHEPLRRGAPTRPDGEEVGNCDEEIDLTTEKAKSSSATKDGVVEDTHEDSDDEDAEDLKATEGTAMTFVRFGGDLPVLATAKVTSRSVRFREEKS